jgi:hypothetical protein
MEEKLFHQLIGGSKYNNFVNMYHVTGIISKKWVQMNKKTYMKGLTDVAEMSGFGQSLNLPM